MKLNIAHVAPHHSLVRLLLLLHSLVLLALDPCLAPPLQRHVVINAQLEALELIADGPDEPVEAGPHRRVRPAADARARRAHLDAARNLVLVRQLLHVQVLHDLTLVHGVRHLLLVRQSTESTPKFSLAKKKKQGWL